MSKTKPTGAPSGDLATTLAEAIGIYLIHPEDREERERVVVTGERAEVWFLRPLERTIESAKCDAYRWLLLGRLKKDVGVRPVFNKFPKLREVTLVFYDIETSVELVRGGTYKQARNPVRQLEITIDRQRALSLDNKGLQKALGGERGACVTAGQQLVNHYWYIK